MAGPGESSCQASRQGAKSGPDAIAGLSNKKPADSTGSGSVVGGVSSSSEDSTSEASTAAWGITSSGVISCTRVAKAVTVASSALGSSAISSSSATESSKAMDELGGGGGFSAGGFPA